MLLIMMTFEKFFMLIVGELRDNQILRFHDAFFLLVVPFKHQKKVVVCYTYSLPIQTLTLGLISF